MSRIDELDNRTYIIGREGHIYIDDKAVSKQHAELQVFEGKFFLRDLNSTNGTFLVEGKTLVRFDKGYLRPEQRVVLGQRAYSISELMDMVLAATIEEDRLQR